MLSSPIRVFPGSQTQDNCSIGTKSPIIYKSNKIAEDREWDDISEDYIKNLKDRCKINSERCNKLSIKNKRLHICFSIPSILIPIIMTPFTQIEEETCEENEESGENISWIKNITTCVLIIITILNTLNTYFDFSKKGERLMQSKYKYDEIYEEINWQLTKPREFRTNVNILTMSLKNNITTLNKTSK
jgi:hypothetical protein